MEVDNTSGSEDIWIFAHQHSGSTKNMEHYFEKAQDYLNEFIDKTNSFMNCCVFYLLWDQQCSQTSYHQLNRIYRRQQSVEGTKLEKVAQWIVDNNLKDKNIHLWLITDGIVCTASKRECESINYYINYKSFRLVLINLINVDISLACAFANNNADCQYEIKIESAGNYKKMDIQPQGFDFDEIKIDNFLEKSEELLNYAQERFNVSDKELTTLQIDDIVRLTIIFIKNLKQKRSNLLLLLKADSSEPNVVEVFDNFLHLSHKIFTDKIKSLPFYNEIKNGIHVTKKLLIDKSDFLIAYTHICQKKLVDKADSNRNYREICFNARSDLQCEEVPDIDVEELSSEVSFLDCLSLCESQSPIICIDRNNYLMDLVQNNDLVEIIEYPFTLINKKDFLKKNSFVCQTYDSGTFKEYLKSTKENKFPINDPNTRALLFGGIVPYEFANNWNDYSISCIFLKGKKVKQSFYDLFYFVLYKKLQVIENIDLTVIEKLKLYALKRIHDGKSKLTFSSLPLEPREIVPIPVAMLYCVQISSEIFGADQSHFKKEKLRNFCFTADNIIEILQHYGMNIDVDLIRKRSALFKYLNEVKNFKENEKLRYILESIFKVEDGFLISKIVAPQNLYMLGFFGHDMTKVAIPMNVTLESIQEKLNFFYSCNEFEPYIICKSTCRPRYLVDNKPFYSKLLRSVNSFTFSNNTIKYVPITSVPDIEFSKLLSMCKIYIAYVLAKKAYPTLEEFTQFLHKKKKGDLSTKSGKIGIFPATIIKDVKEIHGYYEHIAKTVSVEDFIWRARDSFNIDNRIRYEEQGID